MGWESDCLGSLPDFATDHGRLLNLSESQFHLKMRMKIVLVVEIILGQYLELFWGSGNIRGNYCNSQCLTQRQPHFTGEGTEVQNYSWLQAAPGSEARQSDAAAVVSFLQKCGVYQCLPWLLIAASL